MWGKKTMFTLFHDNILGQHFPSHVPHSCQTYKVNLWFCLVMRGETRWLRSLDVAWLVQINGVHLWSLGRQVQVNTLQTKYHFIISNPDRIIWVLSGLSSYLRFFYFIFLFTAGRGLPKHKPMLHTISEGVPRDREAIVANISQRWSMVEKIRCRSLAVMLSVLYHCHHKFVPLI